MAGAALLPTAAGDSRPLRCSSTTPTNMSAAAQVAAIREYWPTALVVLKGIPAAVADKSLPLTDLHQMALQADVDVGRASMYTPDHIVDAATGRPGFAAESRKVLVDEFKVGTAFTEVATGAPWHDRLH